MSKIPANLKYSKTHEWARQESDGSVTVGITDHAQELLGDMVFVDVPPVGKEINHDAEIGVVESVKAASDIYSPLSGKVIAVNESLASKPELVNEDPYGEGWIYRLAPTNLAELNNLSDATAYQKQIDEEQH